jgi:hypothetical protein
MSTLPNSPPQPTASGNPLFGRKYNLQIKSNPDSSGNQTVLTVTDSAFEPEALRITFDVVTMGRQVPWYAEICIYNLNEQTANYILTQGTNSAIPPAAAPNAAAQAVPIQQGMEVILSAGYLNGKYGVIWDGFILQPLWERENQVDFKLTLHCMNWLGIVARNNVLPQAYAAGSTQLQIVQSIMQNSFHPVQQGTISPNLSTKALPRGKVVFGSINKYIGEIARDNNLQWWLDKKGLMNLNSPGGPTLTLSTDPPVVFTPTTGIVDTPAQTQEGIYMRLLLDPTVEVKLPYMTVKVDNSQIRQLLRQAGEYPSFLAQDNTYVVMGARYLGDTRGQDWYVDVTGYLTAAARNLALAQVTGTTVDAAGLQLDGG